MTDPFPRSLPERVALLEALLEEGLTSAWCDAVIGCLPHVEPRRAAKFRDHFYDWQHRSRAVLAMRTGEGR